MNDGDNDGMGFRFKIGDFVVFKTACHDAKLSVQGGEVDPPRVFQVTARIWEECPGGVQRHYVLGSWSHRVNEPELLPLADLNREELQQMHLDARKVRGKLFQAQYEAEKEKP